jgi:hypothetical protein
LLNILPVAWLWAERMPHLKTSILALKKYAGVLQAASYVEPLIWEGDPYALDDALKHFGLEPGQCVVTTPLQRGWPTGRQDHLEDHNFAYAHWINLGEEARWDDLPLVLDRDEERESEVVLDLQPEERTKYVVTCFSATWSPFPEHVAAILSAVLFRTGVPVVDISNYRAGRLDHMLGLLEGAWCLITIDTAILHLAYAVKPPTIALVSDRKWPHSASHPRKFWVDWHKYSEVETSIPSIVAKAKGLCE